MKIVDGSLKRPVTVFMVTVAVVLFGLVAASRLAVDLLPDISYPSLTIRTDLPDAAPADVEQFVTRPVEEGVGVVPGLQRMHSVSRPGQSEVTLEFGSNQRMDLASLAVREKLDLVNLPREARRPAILRFDPSLDPILRLRYSGGGNMQRLRRIADRTIKSELEGVAGVAAVKVVGGEEEEIRVDVDAARLASVGLTLADVSRRLAEENINLAGGSLTEGHSEYLIRATNQFLNPAEIGDVILAARPDGVIRLSDLAHVARGSRDRDVVARVDGNEAVEIAVYKEGDANTVSVARAVRRRVAKLQLPAETKIATVADQSRFIESSIKDVVDSAWMGGLLAILVIFAFLRDVRSTLIIGVSLPVSVLATFIIMYRFGLSFNVMSLGGLALAVGRVVDDSIVVLESVFRKREEGLPPLEAARDGARTVAMAVAASTLTAIAVFLPLVFVEGLAGQLIRDQALTISLSLLASLGVALTIVPILSASQPGTGAPGAGAVPETTATAGPGRSQGGRVAWLIRGLVAAALFVPQVLVRGAAWLARRVAPVVNRLLTPFDRGYAALQRVYPGLLGAALARPGRVLGLSAGAFALSLIVATLLPINLFPASSQGRFDFNVRLAEGTSLEVTDSVLTRIAAAVAGDPRIRTVYTTAGQTDLSAFAGSAREANRGQVAVAMKRATDRRGEEAVAGRLREVMETVPGLGYEFEQPSLLTFRFPVEVEVYAYDLEKLRRASAAVVQRLALVPGLEDVQSSARGGEPEVQIQFDRDRLSAMHLEPESASRLVRNAVQGEAATQFSDLDRKLDVRVRADEGQRDQIARLANLEVGRNNGQPVSLGAVAAVTVARGPGEIRRIAQQRAAVVTANLAGRDLGSAARDIQVALGGLDLPEGARAVLAGQNQELQQSFGSLRFALILAVFLVYLVMASQFESLLHPFIIMFTLPMAVIGVVATLALTRTPVSVMVLIGFIILAGIVVSNGIVLVAYTNQLRHLGRSKLEALVEAGQVRMRPILLTALATILGLVPMALGFGEGAEIRAPLALTLIGGLSCATVLTLIVLPVMYAVLDRSR